MSVAKHGEPAVPVNIYFLNVGHGDCTVIEFPSGRVAMIDINNSKALDEETTKELLEIYGYSEKQFQFYKSLGLKIDKIKEYEEILTDPIDFYLAHFRGKEIFRFIATHPDMDHLSGLYRLHAQEKISILNFWDTKHSVEKSADPEDWKNTPYDIRDWEEYERMRISESDPKALFYLKGDQHQYYAEDGIRIWAPFNHQDEIAEDDDINLLSYILFIEYGECTILLGGDAPAETWQTIYNQRKGTMPKINLLKAPHHGRKSGYYYPAVRAMEPDYTVVSVGKLLRKDDAFASYEKYSVKGCYSTRFHGNISAQCWYDGDVWLYDQVKKRLP